MAASTRNARGVVIAVACAIAGLPGSGAAQPVFRSGVDLVNVGVTVLDRQGAIVKGLTADDFEILEDGVAQRLELFVAGREGAAAPDGELHLGLMLDSSGSMEQDMVATRTAAIKFLNTLTAADDITLVDFDSEVRVARYGQGDFPRLVERIRNRKADGFTALYDALGVYLDGAAGLDGEKVLVLYTDGDDTRSTLSVTGALDLLKASDVTLYAIGFLDHQASSSRLSFRARLQQLSEATGGTAVFPGAVKDLDEVYQRILDEVNGRYLLGYQSSNTRADGTWRPIEIRLKRPESKGLRIRTRKGYFAPYAPGGR